MEQLRTLTALMDYARKIGTEMGPRKVAIALAEDVGVLESIEAARKEGFAYGILVGNGDKIQAAADKAGIDLANYEVVDERRGEGQVGLTAVQLVSSGKADIFMKGMIHTNNFLKALLNKEIGLRTGKTISHCYFHEVKGYDRIFFIADAAFNMYPDLKTKGDILANTVGLARSFGVECPKAAVLAAVEVVNPDMPATLDAAAITQMQRRGQIKNCVVDGPFALDNAVSEESAKHKGIVSEVAGKADILLVPNIDAGNMMVKALVYFSENKTAGLILGASAPVVLTSRSDTIEAKTLSIAAAVALSVFKG